MARLRNAAAASLVHRGGVGGKVLLPFLRTERQLGLTCRTVNKVGLARR